VQAGSNHDSNLNPVRGLAGSDTLTSPFSRQMLPTARRHSTTGHSLEKVAEQQAAPACGHPHGLDKESSSALHGLTIAPAGWNVSQVGTLNQSGMGSAVRRCPRRAVARAQHTGDNRMSGITMNAPPALSVLPEGGFLSPPWEGHTARLASRRLRSSVAVIRAHGGIDASNADTLTEYTVGHLMRCRGLILDLRGLDFFGTEGFSALHRVSVCCACAGIGWAVVSGEAVWRMLRIGDPQGLLPAASTVEAAMATVQDQPHRPPQPIASRRDPGQSSRCERAVCLVCGGTQQVRHEQGDLAEAIAKLDGPALTVADAGV
jgi:anti-anti-sigma factor